MSKAKGLGFVACLLIQGSVGFADSRVIYGDDDRREVFDSRNTPELVELARSTAMLTKTSNLTAEGDFFRVTADTFGVAQGLCADEPFYSQPTPGFCSGFLVGPDLLVTAGHCISNDSACHTISFVFDYGYNTEGKDLSKVPASDVYTCSRLIARVQEPGKGKDYAIVKLNRVVEGRVPLELNRSKPLDAGDSVAVIGHPAGLPSKISANAQVRANDSALPYFVANLDTYGGNSGSAVFNTETGAVEGILVRGETDYVSRNGCVVSNKCENSACRGEDVTKTSVFANLIPAN